MNFEPKYFYEQPVPGSSGGGGSSSQGGSDESKGSEAFANGMHAGEERTELKPQQGQVTPEPSGESAQRQEDPPEVQAAQKALEDPNLSPELVDKAKKMLQARKDAEQAEEGEPKTKAERVFEQAKQDFLDEFSLGKDKIPQNEGEALADILAKALMALMTPLKMVAAKSGLTEAKDDALDAMGDKAKAAAGDLFDKMKGLYKNEEVLKISQDNPSQKNQPNEPEVGGNSPAPKPTSAQDLSDASEVVQNGAKALVSAGLVEEGARHVVSALNLARASVDAQKGDMPAASNSLAGSPNSVDMNSLLSRPPGLTPSSDKHAEEVNATSFKSKLAPPQPTPENPENPEKDDKKRDDKKRLA